MPFPVFWYTAIAVSVIYFAYAFFSDLLTHTIPGVESVILYAVILIHLFFNLSGALLAFRLVFGFLFFLILYIAVRFLHVGGGDALAVTALAILWGVKPAAVILFIGSVLTAIAIFIEQLFQRKKLDMKQEYPLIPGVSISYAGFLMYFFSLKGVM